MNLNESIVEDVALTWFGELDSTVGHGPHLAPSEPAVNQIIANLHQSRTLATLRDTLLPKLVIGELSVAGTEREVVQ